MSRFDVQAHNIRQMTVADALTTYKSTKSLNYKLKLRQFLTLVLNRMTRMIDDGQHSRRVLKDRRAWQGMERMRTDAERIRKALR